ncbi:MAG: hypothetical protein ACI4PU_07285 [Intestinibacter sp.]
MELTGKYIKDMEMLEALKKEIKSFEKDRVQNDLLNSHKFDDLYEVYYKLQDKLKL